MSETVLPAAPAPAPSAVRDPRRALVAAGAVAAVLLLQLLASLLESVVRGSQDLYVGGYLVPQLFVNILPTAVGVFLLLWLWPVQAGERGLLVLAKGLLAALAGCVVATLVGLVYVAITYGLRFSELGALSYNPFDGFASSVLGLAPLVMLVVVVQWVLSRGARL